jgi:uroporphyrinogen III methyltransferase/synthase
MLNQKDPRQLTKLLKHTAIAAIGPITGQTVRESGLQVDIQPDTHTIPELVEAIVRHFAG